MKVTILFMCFVAYATSLASPNFSVRVPPQGNGNAGTVFHIFLHFFFTSTAFEHRTQSVKTIHTML